MAAVVNFGCAMLRSLSFVVAELPVVLRIDGAARSADTPGAVLVPTVTRGGAWQAKLTDLVAAVTNRSSMFHAAYLVMCIWGVYMLVTTPAAVPFPFVFLLLDVVNRQRVLKAVLSAVTQNTEALWQTALLGLILLYIYAVLGFSFFRDDYKAYVCAQDCH